MINPCGFDPEIMTSCKMISPENLLPIDRAKAVNGVFRASFGYSGQKCSACSIAYIQSGIYDKFKDQLLP